VNLTGNAGKRLNEHLPASNLAGEKSGEEQCGEDGEAGGHVWVLGDCRFQIADFGRSFGQSAQQALACEGERRKECAKIDTRMIRL
jgi:hypothetical protein